MKNKKKNIKTNTSYGNKINNFIERIGNTTNERLIDNYESKVDDLEKEKQIILQKMDKNISQLKNVRTSLKDKLKLAMLSKYGTLEI
ncbi:MAG: hypothetical protein Q9M97_06780 [Candidatus Gracilibacteria bacterium]|nr:hypothetical protein [Candidatus Gracilibacteria bacterium]